MPKQPPYRIEYDAEAREHLRKLDARDRAAVADNLERKLKHEPTLATRNKKLLRANELAPWELRVGEWRVLYDPGRGCPVGVDTDILHAVGVWGGRGASLTTAAGDY